jgi:type I restriction enzyme, S subunit
MNQACAAIEPNRGIDPIYLLTYLRENYDLIRSLSNSGGQENLSGEIVKKIPVVVPPLSTQLRIAAIVHDTSNLVRVLEQLIGKKQAIKRGMMQQLLTGKTHLHGFNDPWKRVTLGEIGTVSRGASPRPIASSRWFDESGSVGWVRISDVSRSDGLTLTSTTQRLSSDGIMRSRFLPAGTLIMSIAATVGVPIVTGIETCIHDGFVAIERLRGTDQTYLLYVLKSLESELRSAGQTGSQANVNTDIVKRIRINLPSVSEQVQIGNALKDIDLSLLSLRHKLQKALALRQGMMQQLLSGRTRLQVPEPAL